MPWASIVGDAHEQNQPHDWEKKFPAHSHTLLDTLNGCGGGRFESDSRRMFSVEDEVGRWAAEGRL